MDATREVVILCGPPGAGKTTTAKASRLTIYDRDEAQWASEQEFTNAIAALRDDPEARAVIIRSAATSSARKTWATMTGATHVYAITPSQAICAHRVKNRKRADMRTSLAAIPAWYAKHDREDGVQDFPGWGAHRMSADRARYQWAHQQERERWAPKVKRGDVTCWRCGERIDGDEPWDLGHLDGSETEYGGPEHRACNRGAAAKLTNQRRRGKTLPTSEAW